VFEDDQGDPAAQNSVADLSQRPVSTRVESPLGSAMGPIDHPGVGPEVSLVDQAVQQERGEHPSPPVSKHQHCVVPSLDLDFPVSGCRGSEEKLTPLGGGGEPRTPVMITTRSMGGGGAPLAEQTSEHGKLHGASHPPAKQSQSQSQPFSPTPPLPPPSGPRVVETMIVDGTPLVLHEEAEGRLQARHPWLYSAAEDLRTVRPALCVCLFITSLTEANK